MALIGGFKYFNANFIHKKRPKYKNKNTKNLYKM